MVSERGEARIREGRVEGRISESGRIKRTIQCGRRRQIEGYFPEIKRDERYETRGRFHK